MEFLKRLRSEEAPETTVDAGKEAILDNIDFVLTRIGMEIKTGAGRKSPTELKAFGDALLEFAESQGFDVHVKREMFRTRE